MISHRQLFLQHVAQTSPAPLALEIVKAKGMYLTDRKRKRYLDVIGGISVCNLGHNHPAVVRAVQKQANDYLHVLVYGEFVQQPQVHLARLLTRQLPPCLQSVYFVSSGAEAVEGALKLAKRYTGKRKIFSFENAYHGSTHGALSIMGSEYFKAAYRPLLPETYMLRFNEFSDLSQIDQQTAAVVVEPVQGEAGAMPANRDWLWALRKRCSEVGAMLIFDEIQTGYGRTGALFAFQKYDVTPDILMVAKGFGGGMPLGAFIASQKIMQTLTHNPVLGHITTFGGHPVSCAAGLATLKTLLNSNLISEVEGKAALFKSLLVHPRIQNVTGEGLLLAVHFESEEFNFAVIKHCIEDGVLTDWFLFNAKALRLAPPLIISVDQIKKACNKILKAIDKAALQFEAEK